MVWFIVVSGGLWFLGRRLGTPASARWLMIGLLYVVFVAAAVALPPGNPLRTAIGGSTAEWMAIGLVALIVWLYGQGLGRLKARIRPEAAARSEPAASDVELERYARHIVLREIGGPGQRRLREARVLVVGAGGLGAPALLYLGASGVGTLGVIDDDVVENANLQRQVIHTDDRIGMPKVFSAQRAVAEQNPYVSVRPYHRRLTDEIAAELLKDYDLVLDCSDNFDTRYLVNEAAVTAGLPMIGAALSQWEGQISLYDPAHGAPCYRCIFPEPPAPHLAPSCAEAGVLGPLPGVVGAMMAVEAVKEIARAGDGLRGRMLIYDALHGETRTIALTRRPDCPVCGTV